MIDGVPGIQAQQFYRCGMQQPCDGDNNKLEKNPDFKATFPTWCFVNKDCENAIKSAPDADDGYVKRPLKRCCCVLPACGAVHAFLRAGMNICTPQVFVMRVLF